MKSKLRWITVSTTLASLMYFGFFRDIDGIKNIMIFFAWLMFLASTFSMTNQVQAVFKAKPWPARRNAVRDIIFTCVFIWFGYWTTGAAYFIHMVFLQAGWKKAEDAKEAGDDSEAETQG